MSNDRKRNEEIAAFDNSEVMANFVKIAYDSGIIEMEEKGGDIDVKGLETADKDVLDEKYNVHPGPDKDGRDLVGRAHPDKVNILDSYLNGGGVVENEQEAQDIDIQVANKKPYFNDRHHREIAVASQELVDQLVLIADEMDIREEHNIAKFADNMIIGINKSSELVKKKLIKQAGVGKFLSNPKVLRWIAGIAGIGLAATYLGKEVESGEVVSVEDAVDAFINNLKAFKNEKAQIQSIQLDVGKIDTLIAQLENTKQDYILVRSMFIEKYQELTQFIQIGDPQEVVLNHFAEMKELYGEIVKALHNVKNTYTKGILSQKGIENILARMSQYEKSDKTSSSWDNLFNNTKRIMEMLYSKKQDAENALSLLDRSIAAELSMRKNDLEYATRLMQQYNAQKTTEIAVEEEPEESITNRLEG